MDSAYNHMVFNLVIVLAFLMVLAYIAKKVKLKKFSSNKHINIINTIPIGTKEKIFLIEVNNTTLLIGSTPNHIETLYVFNKLGTINAVNDDASNHHVTFSDHLKATQN
jgi:flagellar biosynthetic protein FliO